MWWCTFSAYTGSPSCSDKYLYSNWTLPNSASTEEPPVQLGFLASWLLELGIIVTMHSRFKIYNSIRNATRWVKCIQQQISHFFCCTTWLVPATFQHEVSTFCEKSCISWEFICTQQSSNISNWKLKKRSIMFLLVLDGTSYNIAPSQS